MPSHADPLEGTYETLASSPWRHEPGTRGLRDQPRLVRAARRRRWTARLRLPRHAGHAGAEPAHRVGLPASAGAPRALDPARARTRRPRDGSDATRRGTRAAPLAGTDPRRGRGRTDDRTGQQGPPGR